MVAGPLSTCLLAYSGSYPSPTWLWQGHWVGTGPGSPMRPASLGPSWRQLAQHLRAWHR